MPGQKQYTSAFSIDQLLDLMNRLYNLNLEITTERNLPLIISRIDDVYLKMLLLKIMVNGTDEFIPFKQSPNSVRSISVEPITISDDKEISLSSSEDYLVSIIYNNNQRDDFICTYDETKWKCTARDINEVVTLINRSKQINKTIKSVNDDDDEDIEDQFFKDFKK